MRLSARPLINYANINLFSYEDQWTVWAGSPTTLYFQLIDLDQDSLRYLAGISSQNEPVTLIVTFPTNASALNTYNNETGGGFIPYLSTIPFPNTAPSQVFSVTASQADPNDASIWSVTLGPLQIPNTGNVWFSLAEGSNIRNFNVMAMINVEPLNNGSC